MFLFTGIIVVGLSFRGSWLSKEHRFLNFVSLIHGLGSSHDAGFQNWFSDFGPRLSNLVSSGNFCGTLHNLVCLC